MSNPKTLGALQLTALIVAGDDGALMVWADDRVTKLFAAMHDGKVTLSEAVNRLEMLAFIGTAQATAPTHCAAVYRQERGKD